MEPALFYVDHSLDRSGLLRDQPGALAALRADPRSKRVLLKDLALALAESGDAPRLYLPDVEEFGAPIAEDATFLGVADGIAHFAEEAPDLALPFEDLRAIGARLPPFEAGLAAYGRAFMHWHARTGFCSRCGHPLRTVRGGHVRHCDGCGLDHFPRTDPAVIMLVTKGDRCVLGHSQHFLENMYSTLAGFLEPGETLEQAVRREVLEEVGITIGAVAYMASQPWPFPQSLMVGFHAEALDEEISLEDPEIVDARWFSRAELRDPERRPIRLPRQDSIARYLVETWLNQET